MSDIKMIEPQHWTQFLEEFSARNRDRRARFHIFSGGEMNEEEQEAHFESAALEKDGSQSNVVVSRLDRAGEEDKRMTDKIENVRGISVQYEIDGSENILELTNDKNHLISLRFESRLDGAS